MLLLLYELSEPATVCTVCTVLYWTHSINVIAILSNYQLLLVRMDLNFFIDKPCGTAHLVDDSRDGRRSHCFIESRGVDFSTEIAKVSLDRVTSHKSIVQDLVVVSIQWPASYEVSALEPLSCCWEASLQFVCSSSFQFVFLSLRDF